MMLTEQQVRQALREEIDRHGDGSNVLLRDVVADGRRRRRGSSLRRVAGGVTALAVSGGAAFALVSAPAAATTWQLAPAPDQVNERILELVEEQLPAGADVSDVELTAYADPAPGQGSAHPGGDLLPRDRWSEADAWRVRVTLDNGTTIQVALGHAKGETEGDIAANCAADVAAGYYTVCDGETVNRQGEDVDVAWREGDADLTADGMLWGPGTLDAPDGEPTPAATPVSTRELETQPGGDFLVSVLEISPEGEASVLERDAMADIALDAELLEAR